MIAHTMIPLHASQLSQDKSLHVLFDLMTNAWGQDPAAAEEHPEDDDEDLGPGAVEDAYPDLAEDSGVSGPGDASIDSELSALTQQLQILKSLGCNDLLRYAFDDLQAGYRLTCMS